MAGFCSCKTGIHAIHGDNRFRGAKHRRRYELLGGISLLSRDDSSGLTAALVDFFNGTEATEAYRHLGLEPVIG